MSDVKHTWNEMVMRLAAAFPQWVINHLDRKGESYPFVVKAIPVVIVLLSIASIETIRTRVEFHHSAWQTPAVAAGVAILVPLATLAAALIRKRSWAILFWVVSFVVASISGSIQYGVYVVANATIMQTVEAIAFGFGIPFAEVLFAIMEAVMIRQWLDDRAAAERMIEQQTQAEQRANDEAAKQSEQERKAQIRRDLDEQDERLRKQQEFESEQMQKQREFELKLKIQEAEALAKIERERVKVEAKLGGKPVQESVQKTVQASKGKRPKKPEILDRMIVHYRENPHLSAREMADLVGISKSSVSNYLDELGQKNVVHVNGNGVEVLRDL